MRLVKHMHAFTSVHMAGKCSSVMCVNACVRNYLVSVHCCMRTVWNESQKTNAVVGGLIG